MFEEGLSVIKLDKDNIKRYLSDLLEVEHHVYLKRGHQYSIEEWGESHFLFELPGKYDLSFGVVMEEMDKLIAFMIASESMPGVTHLHRSAVHPKYPGNNIGRKLYLKVYQEWSNMPEYKTFTTITRTDHKITVPFSKKLGGKIADKSYMAHYFKRMGRTDVQIFDDHFKDTYGISYVLIYFDK